MNVFSTVFLYFHLPLNTALIFVYWMSETPVSSSLKRGGSPLAPDDGKILRSDVSSDSDRSTDGESDPDSSMQETLTGSWSIESRKKIPSRRKSSTHQLNATEFPVFLEDVGGENDPRYHSYGQFTNGLFKSINVNDVSRQRRLSAGKWLIYVKSVESQNKLVATSDLAGIKVKCEIPSRNAIGVIKPVPLSINMEQIKISCPTVKDAFRLKNKDGVESNAIKIVFKQNQLPNEIKVGNEIRSRSTFVEPVLRCSKCQKLNHKKSSCRSKECICPRCGKTAHDSNDPTNNIKLCQVPPEKRYCVNCKSTGHSAAWKGCPSQQTQKRINTEAARSGVPFGIARHTVISVSKPDPQPLSPVLSSTPFNGDQRLPGSQHSLQVNSNLAYSDVAKGILKSSPQINNQNSNLEIINCMTNMFQTFEVKMNDKLTGFEHKIMSNLHVKRKDQKLALKAEVESVTLDKPTKHIAANIIQNVVLASEGNPGPLVEMINNLTSERRVSSRAEPLVWDNDLEYMTQLAIPSFTDS